MGFNPFDAIGDVFEDIGDGVGGVANDLFHTTLSATREIVSIPVQALSTLAGGVGSALGNLGGPLIMIVVIGAVAYVLVQMI